MFTMKKKKKNDEISEITLQLTAEELEEMVTNDVLIGYSSIIGTRESQQDSFFADKISKKRITLAIVCDGMGGLSGGEIASSRAVDYLKEKLFRDIEESQIYNELLEETKLADKIVSDLTDDEGSPLQAGTTMVLALIKNGRLNWASVGDSKIFLFRNNELLCLTNEHNYTFMAEQKKNDSNFHFNPATRKDALVSYLGAGSLRYIDINIEPLELIDEDIIILCSDGLYKSLSEEQIKVMFLSEKDDMTKAAEMLTTAALMNSMDTQDNTTVVLLKYKNSI